jgi:hypothetical protein
MVLVVEELAELDRALGGTTEKDILGLGGGKCHIVLLLGNPSDGTAVEHDNLP